jgi:hypothetical protein
MHTRLILLSLVFMLILLFPGEAVSNTTDSFTITGADAVAYVDTSGSSELNSHFGTVLPRFVVQAANSLGYFSLTPAPAGLSSLLTQVMDRFVIQAANANSYYPFVYPMDIIGDASPPRISGLTAASHGLISWETDEYTISQLLYGTQSGNYPNELTNPLYYRNHQFQLSGLTAGETYYFRVRCTDRSGNMTTSGERSFTYQTVKKLYLPMTVKINP